ncbi:MAG: hypothetical protein ACLUI3_07540 [Christensenellales bacterium]
MSVNRLSGTNRRITIDSSCTFSPVNKHFRLPHRFARFPAVRIAACPASGQKTISASGRSRIRLSSSIKASLIAAFCSSLISSPFSVSRAVPPQRRQTLSAPQTGKLRRAIRSFMRGLSVERDLCTAIAVFHARCHQSAHLAGVRLRLLQIHLENRVLSKFPFDAINASCSRRSLLPLSPSSARLLRLYNR